jgi:hypothetical protein
LAALRNWFRDVFREAAWPGVTVLVVHAVLGEVFGHEPYVDPAMHFLGGVAAALFFSRIGPFIPSLLGTLLPPARRILAFTATTTVAVLWELGEYLSDLYLGTHAHTSIGSTLRDLFNGMLGALVYVAAESLLASSSVIAGKAPKG